MRHRGHAATSCDLEPGQGTFKQHHHRGDVKEILEDGWDLMIGFPPCQYITKMRYTGPQLWAALDFVEDLMNAPIPKIAIENPVGRISTYIRKPDQIIQPWWFGEPWTKATCLWLKNLPPLISTNCVPHIAQSWTLRHNDSKTRGITFPGIANAMADQWG
jgi:hypothetical protein